MGKKWLTIALLAAICAVIGVTALLVARFNAQNARYEERLNEIAEARSRLQERLDAAEAAGQRQEEALTEMTSLRDAAEQGWALAEQETKTLNASLLEAKQNAEEAKRVSGNLQEELTQAESSIQALEKEKAALTEQLAQAQASRDEARQENDALKEQTAALTSQLAALREAAQAAAPAEAGDGAALAQENYTLNNEIKNLKSQLSASQDKAERETALRESAERQLTSLKEQAVQEQTAAADRENALLQENYALNNQVKNLESDLKNRTSALARETALRESLQSQVRALSQNGPGEESSVSFQLLTQILLTDLPGEKEGEQPRPMFLTLRKDQVDLGSCPCALTASQEKEVSARIQALSLPDIAPGIRLYLQIAGE